MISTGLPALDERLGGGLPAGSLVALTAPPDSQSEQLLYAAAAATDGARYRSTFRPADEIREVFDAAYPNADVPVDRVRDDEFLSDPASVVGDGEGLLVVDTATELERAGRDEYRRALDVVKRRLRSGGGAAVLHCLDIEPSPMRRGLTLGRADVALRLRFAGLPERVVPHLLVTKLRGGTAPEEAVRLRFDDQPQVVVDDSEDS